MLEALKNKWGDNYAVIAGEEIAKYPDLIAFKNCDIALDILHRHIENHSRILVHCDVDMDGIGSGYILKRFLQFLTPIKQGYVINKEKEHGVMQRHVDIINNNKIDLLIILDSSSNELEVIKQFKCDVIVIDHHEILHNETVGNTNDRLHRFVIVNNMIDNFDSNLVMEWLKKNNSNTDVRLEDYEHDSRMSCGLVLYELLRLYCEGFNKQGLLENLMLFQWAGVTLFTDAILLNTERNQWYIEKTVHSNLMEQTLSTMLTTLSKYNLKLSKSNINYSLAPVINKAIRAGASGEALEVVLYNPNNISKLLKYKEDQDRALDIGIKDVEEHNTFVIKNLTDTGISPNYSGVIASKLCDEYNKNAIVYTEIDGLCKGSFRGRINGIDYRTAIEQAISGNYAQGHKSAFGIKILKDNLIKTIDNVKNLDSTYSNSKEYLTAGDMPDSLKGEYHISNFNAFKLAGGLIKLGIGNSKVSSDEQIMISVPSSLATLIDQKGKLYIYDVLGVQCKAFSEVVPGIIKLYAEYSNSLDIFIK